MSRTFKDQPWKVKASKWNASNAEPWHYHHNYRVEYEDAVDRYGRLIYDIGVKIIEYESYSQYFYAKKRAGEEPISRELIPQLPLHTDARSHDRVIWEQRVKYDWAEYYHYEVHVYERVEYRNVVRRPVEPVIVCTIDEPLTGANDWGSSLRCTYHQRTPLKVAFAQDRIERKRRSAKLNRRISRDEMHALKKQYAVGVTEDEEEDITATAHVVLKRNDWLG